MLGRKKKGKEELHTANKINQEKINKNKGSKKSHHLEKEAAWVVMSSKFATVHL